MSGVYLNLGCGSTILPAPWRNHDMDMDITKPLPFKDGEVRYIVICHCVEHVTCSEAYKFFEEAFRVLQKGGVLRVAVPDVERIQNYADLEYLEWLGKSGFGQPTHASAIRNIVVNHGHKSMWNDESLFVCLEAVGFEEMQSSNYGKSLNPDLTGIEGHHKVIGLHPAWVETTVVEAVK